MVAGTPTAFKVESEVVEETGLSCCMTRVLSTGGGGWGGRFYPKLNIFPPKNF